MRSILLFFLIASLSGSSFAQVAETFDIATFKAPKGWDRKATASSLQFSTEDKSSGSYCVLTVFKALPGIGDSRANFDAAWAMIAKETIGVSIPPTMMPANNPDDWKAEMGSAPFEREGVKGAAVLVTVSGHGLMLNMLVLTNSQTFEPAITAFLESVTLKKPEIAPTAAANPPQPTGQGGSELDVTSFNWKQSKSRKDPMGNNAGYSNGTYVFGRNNTYKFSAVSFQFYTPKYYLENEEGTYKITGNKITITPKNAVFSSHNLKKEDPPAKSGNLGLITVQYSLEIVNLNNNWTLLLSPVDGVETKRDGPFSFWFDGEKKKTYSYNAVNAEGELIR